MKDINRVFLEGRLTRDIGERDYRATVYGQAVLTFSIASNHPKKKGDGWEDEASYFDVVCFGKQADALSKILCKGSHVFIEGALRQERWEAKDGTRKSAVRVYADLCKVERQLPATQEHEARASSAADEFIDDIPF